MLNIVIESFVIKEKTKRIFYLKILFFIENICLFYYLYLDTNNRPKQLSVESNTLSNSNTESSSIYKSNRYDINSFNDGHLLPPESIKMIRLDKKI